MVDGWTSERRLLAVPADSLDQRTALTTAHECTSLQATSQAVTYTDASGFITTAAAAADNDTAVIVRSQGPI